MTSYYTSFAHWPCHKARHIIQTCHRLIDTYQGHVPLSRQALITLPGVGRKTANVVLNTAFGQPMLAVDTHIFRVAHRLSWSKETTPDGVEKDILAKTPAPYCYALHHWLILLGRYLCKARRPLCDQCPLQTHCPYWKKNGKKKKNNL